MIVAEPYQRDGRTCLRNIHQADAVPQGYVDTGLAEIPGGFAKLAWDGTQVVPIVPTEEEKLDKLDVPRRVLAALVMRAAPSATPAQRQRAGEILDAFLPRIEAAR